MTVHHEGGLVYLDGHGMTDAEADSLARRLQAAAGEARGWRSDQREAERRRATVARLEASGLTHIETRSSAVYLWYIGRRDGLPVVIDGTEKPARFLSEVGDGPPLEWRCYSGRKWRPLSELGPSSHVGGWRVVAP